MIAGGNWWRAKEIVIRHLTRRTETRYRSRVKTPPTLHLHDRRRAFPGKVTRIADTLQSGTRTLLADIDILNPDDALPPGVCCTVEPKIPRPRPSLVVAADSSIFNRNGLQDAVVNDRKAQISETSAHGWKRISE
jgi:hypothetical protein